MVHHSLHIDSAMQKQEQAERRQQIVRIIYSLWTQDGSDEAGFAPALFDGRLDALSYYAMGSRSCCCEDEDAAEPTTAAIDRIHCKDLSYADFCANYMYPNRPFIIQGLTANWKSRQLWVRHDDGTPNMKYIGETFGSDIAPIYEQTAAGFSTTRPVSSEMSVAQYADWWDEHQQVVSEAGSLLYLKDWKFVAAHPYYEAYEWPHFFCDDWLNEAMGNAYKYVSKPSAQSTMSPCRPELSRH
jgi:hypothetical protein